MKKKVKIIAVIIAIMLVAVFGYSVYYVNDYYQAVDIDEYISTNESVEVTKTDKYYLFDGKGEDKALIFYPGAKVEAEAYSPVLMQLAENGIDCYLVKMPFNLAFFGINRADDIMAQGSYNSYLLAGHSLGGAMISSCAQKNIDDIDGLYLLASYSTYDLSNAKYPVVSIYGTNDTVLNKENLEKYKANMPSTYSEFIIDGGNHSGFASYGEQKGDSPADISKQTQWQKTAEIILNN